MKDHEEYEPELESDDLVRAEVEAIARRVNSNGGVTPQDQFDLTLAVDHSAYKRHVATKRQVARLTTDVKKINTTLTAHIAEAAVRDLAIQELQADKLHCPAVVRAAIETEHERCDISHATIHAEHMRTEHAPRRIDDPPESDHTSDRDTQHVIVDEGTKFKVWVMWGAAAVLTNAAVSAIMYVLIAGVFHK
jgi:hypothetical protein